MLARNVLRNGIQVSDHRFVFLDDVHLLVALRDFFFRLHVQLSFQAAVAALVKDQVVTDAARPDAVV